MRQWLSAMSTLSRYSSSSVVLPLSLSLSLSLSRTAIVPRREERESGEGQGLSRSFSLILSPETVRNTLFCRVVPNPVRSSQCDALQVIMAYAHLLKDLPIGDTKYQYYNLLGLDDDRYGKRPLFRLYQSYRLQRNCPCRFATFSRLPCATATTSTSRRCDGHGAGLEALEQKTKTIR